MERLKVQCTLLSSQLEEKTRSLGSCRGSIVSLETRCTALDDALSSKSMECTTLQRELETVLMRNQQSTETIVMLSNECESLKRGKATAEEELQLATQRMAMLDRDIQRKTLEIKELRVVEDKFSASESAARTAQQKAEKALESLVKVQNREFEKDRIVTSLKSQLEQVAKDKSALEQRVLSLERMLERAKSKAVVATRSSSAAVSSSSSVLHSTSLSQPAHPDCLACSEYEISVSRLQSRLSSLETEVAEKDQRIALLEYACISAQDALVAHTSDMGVQTVPIPVPPRPQLVDKMICTIPLVKPHVKDSWCLVVPLVSSLSTMTENEEEFQIRQDFAVLQSELTSLRHSLHAESQRNDDMSRANVQLSSRCAMLETQLSEMSISLTEAREGMKSVMDKQAQIQTRAFSLERDKRGAEASVDKLRTELDAERQRNSKLDSVWRRKCDKLERDIEHMKVAVQITPAARDATVASADDLIREVHDLEREIRMIKSHRDELAQELSVKEAEIDDLKHCIREILSWAKIVKDEHQQFKTFVVETLRCGKEGIDSVSEHILPPFRTLQQSLHSHAEIVVADCQRLSGDLLSLESEVSGLRGREAELNRELSFVKSRLDKSEEQLRKKSKECSTLQARFEEVESAKKVDDEKIVRLQSLVSRLQAQAQKDAAREKAKEKDKSREEAVSLYASTMHDLSNKENEELRVAYMAEHTRLQRCLSTMSQKEKIITSQQEQIRTLEANLEKARKECDLRRSTSIRTEASTTSLQKKCADLESARQAENEALREHQRMTKALCAEVERLMDDLSKERDMVRILNAEKADLETRLDDMQLHVEALQVQLQAAEMACKASASPKVKKTSSVAQSNAVSKTATRPRSGYST